MASILSFFKGSSEPLPRYFHISSRVGSKVVVQGGVTKDLSVKSRQHLSSVVEIFDLYSESWEQRPVAGDAPSPGTYGAASASLHDDLFSDMMAVNASKLSADWTLRSCAGVKCLLRMQTELPCPSLGVE